MAPHAGVGVHHPLTREVFPRLKALCTCIVRISWRFPHTGVINDQLCFHPLSLLWWMGGRQLKVQASNHGLVFLVTSSHPGAHPESPYENRRCSQSSYHLGNYHKDFKLCARNQGYMQINVYKLYRYILKYIIFNKIYICNI